MVTGVVLEEVIGGPWYVGVRAEVEMKVRMMASQWVMTSQWVVMMSQWCARGNDVTMGEDVTMGDDDVTMVW